MFLLWLPHTNFPHSLQQFCTFCSFLGWHKKQCPRRRSFAGRAKLVSSSMIPTLVIASLTFGWHTTCCTVARSCVHDLVNDSPSSISSWRRRSRRREDDYEVVGGFSSDHMTVVFTAAMSRNVKNRDSGQRKVLRFVEYWVHIWSLESTPLFVLL